MNHEQKVREFYNNAAPCFEAIMGDVWHFGDPAAEARGLSAREAALLLEERLVAETGLTAGGRALDFGSGVGGGTLHMARVSGARFVGLTNNEVCNQKARARAAAVGLDERVSFLTIGDRDYKNLPFPDASFDAAFFLESVCHLPDKPAFFREMFRLLKPGARLAGMDWLQRPFGAHQTEAQILAYMGPVNELYCIPQHGTVEGYRAMAEAAGFGVRLARDLYEGALCLGCAPPEHREGFAAYLGPEQDMLRRGKVALDA
ncbi:MAG TPA: methyltransferase domain-containing protein, partial [Polyangiaceae bacterium]|nr:methyltransferase domain-containing protein [Polyangiaceae bacterium]